MGKEKNEYWSTDDLLLLIVDENPCISYLKAYKKARFFWRELSRLNMNLYNNNKKYYKHNVPLSYFRSNDNT